jgi:hypothetical protein
MVKSEAADEGRSVEQLILRSVEQELKRRAHRRVSLPIVPSKQPGTLNVDNDKIFEVIPFP